MFLVLRIAADDWIKLPLPVREKVQTMFDRVHVDPFIKPNTAWIADYQPVIDNMNLYYNATQTRVDSL